jgi:1,4-alpha-glucan branching enzyme
MKKFLSLFLLIPCFVFSQQQTVTYTISPTPTFEGTNALTITVNGSSINETTWSVTNNQLYAWVWALNTANANIPFGGNGDWSNSNNSQLMNYNAVTDTYSFTYSPSVFNFFGSTEVAKVGFLIKAKNGTGDKKSQDIVLNVGSYQVTLLNGIVAGDYQLFSTSYTIAARHTGSTSNYVLKRNGTIINTQNNLPASAGAPSYTYADASGGDFNNYSLEVTQSGVTKTYNFSTIKTITPVAQALPVNQLDGINYSSDHTKATLVLNAPLKDFVYVAGNFNNWQPTSSHAMKKDPATGKFWLEITGLTPEQWYAFQYWVCDDTNVPTNSPKIVKTADPFSTLVLSPFDDPEIIQLGVYPGLPVYDVIAPGQQREVSVIQTGTNTFRSYNWSAATLNFQKPAIKDLVFYEVLVRDFDSNRTFQDLIDKFNYFKNLNINAIKLMPVMEFEGNLSWGYNTVYHLALDKRYGPPAKLKQFIDLCHQNGIAVVLDIALNHVFGRSPLERMWMLDTNNDGWSDGYPRVTTENPYINRLDAHSYSVGSDLNHFIEPNNLTNTYSVRAIKHWIEEFKIDGYRWDLTKGFTNQCPPGVAGGQEVCTNGYRSDRVAKLKWYADKQWEADNNSYCIFEHLGVGGSSDEENEWSGYRIPEGKGIMQWRKMTDAYANLIKGNGANLLGVTGANDRFVGYAESHDEERVIYKAITEAGQTQGNLTKALKRLSAQGAVHLLVPGPKMIWHFGALGWDKSLWTCTNGNVSFTNPDCKLDTKPQPQWVENWLTNAQRSVVYNDWAKMIKLRIENPVFENGQFSWNMTNSSRPRLDIWTSTSQTSSLSYVIVLTNFTDSAASLGGFPFTGNWVNLMDNSSVDVTSTSQTFNIEAGGFRVFGNKPSTLSSEDFNAFKTEISIYPNPVKNSFAINQAVSSVEVYTITGQLVASYNSVAANQEINVENLGAGIYLVKIKDIQNVYQTKKIVIE